MTKRLMITGLCGLFAIQLTAKQPNVLFILADDLGIGGLHCFGSELVETPNLDRLRADGMKFSNGLAAYPTCKPSRAAILSGQYGPRTGVYRVKDDYGQTDKARYLIPENGQLSEKKITLGTAFKNAGYATAMYGKWHVSNEKQKHPKAHYGFDEAYVSSGAHYHATSIPPVDLPEDTMIEKLYSQLAATFMEKSVQQEKPFFIYMPYFLVHGPSEARPDYIAHFKEKLRGHDLEQGGKALEVTLSMTLMLDDFVGILLEQLTALRIADDTVVVFTSDNGSYDRNLVGGYRGSKGDTYDGGLRVPYIFRWPGQIKPGSESKERVIGVDLYPTLLGLANIEVPSDYPLDGANLSSLLLGKQTVLPSRSVYCFYPKYVRYNHKTKRWAHSWRNVIYNGNYRLIEYPEYGETELFDLANDPREETNLAKTSPEKHRALSLQLHRWLGEINAPKLEPNPNHSLK